MRVYKHRPYDPERYQRNKKKHYEQNIRARRRRLYGMEPDEWDRRVMMQAGCCAVCLTPFTKNKTICVDHCHDTEDVRGLLCSQCNTGIGSLGDTSLAVKRALDYLERHEMNRKDFC